MRVTPSSFAASVRVGLRFLGSGVGRFIVASNTVRLTVKLTVTTLFFMNSDFSTNLRLEMARQNLTQSALARKLGTRQSTVRGWLNGSMPEAQTLNDLINALGISRSALFEKVQRPVHRGGGDMARIQGMKPEELGEEIKRLFAIGDPKAPYLVDHVIARLGFAEAESKP